MFKWLVNNVRRGFATNSSSSHSMVHFKEPVASPDTSYSEIEFGWNEFRLGSLGDKLMYALVAYVSRAGYNNWWTTVKEEDVDEVQERFGHLFPEFDREAFRDALSGSIDHQSQPSLPDEMLAAARDPHIVIYGGNDNGGTTIWDLVDQFQDNDTVDWIACTDSPTVRTDPHDEEQRKNIWW